MPQKMQNITETPLTNEELALYTTHLSTETDKKIEALQAVFTSAIGTVTAEYNKNLTDLADNIEFVGKALLATEKRMNENLIQMTEAIIAKLPKYIASAVTDAMMDQLRNYLIGLADTIKESRATGDSISLFSSTLNQNQQDLWVEEARGKIASICLKNSWDKENVYSYAYEKMKEHNYNITTLMEDYKKTHNIKDGLSMIAASDTLRFLFEKIINSYVVINKGNFKAPENKVQKDDFQSTATKPEFPADLYSTKSYYINICPQNVRDIVSRVSKTGRISSNTYTKAYSLLDRAEIDACVKAVCEKTGFKKCSIGYAISTNPVLMAKFRAAVDEYVNKQEAA